MHQVRSKLESIFAGKTPNERKLSCEQIPHVGRHTLYGNLLSYTCINQRVILFYSCTTTHNTLQQILTKKMFVKNHL